MPERRYRVLAVAAHPVQYMAPIFRRMAERNATAVWQLLQEASAKKHS
jgi:hypothetical protein